MLKHALKLETCLQQQQFALYKTITHIITLSKTIPLPVYHYKAIKLSTTQKFQTKHVSRFLWQIRQYTRWTLHHTWPPASHQCNMEEVESKKGKEEIETQLREMTMEGISTPQAEPTTWMSSPICPHKANWTLRVCMDQKDLNKAIIKKKLTRTPH